MAPGDGDAINAKFWRKAPEHPRDVIVRPLGWACG